jgi:hypothetical protein
MQPDTVWLVCWALGGLVLMSFIPSKRVDRIFPVVPPLCLLLGAQVARGLEHERWRATIRPWLIVSIVFACLFTGGYAAFKIGSAYRAHDDALVKFSREVRREAEARHWRYAVVGGREEGILLYLRRDDFLPPDDAVKEWNTGQLDALVVRNEPAQPWLELLHGAQLQSVSKKATGKAQYSLFTRSAALR